MRRTMFRAAAAAAAIAATAAGSATGAVVERGQFDDETYGFGYDCGFPMEAEGVASGLYRLRDGGDGIFLSLDRVDFREVHTNTETGRSFVIRGHFAANETRARQVSDSLFELDTIKAGQMRIVEDANGVVVSRDRGVLRQTLLFDTGGDNQPGGTVVDVLDLRIAGQQSGFGRLCEIAEELTSNG